MQPQLLSPRSSLFRDCAAGVPAERVCVLFFFFYALGGVRLCTRACSTLKWQVLKELPDGCVLRGRLPRLMIMKN